MKYLQKIANNNTFHALDGLLLRDGNIVACDSYKYIETANPFEFDKNLILQTDHTKIIDDITETRAGDGAWIHRNDMQSPATYRPAEDYPDIDDVTPTGEPEASMELTAWNARELFEALDRDAPDENFTIEIHKSDEAGDQLKVIGEDGTTALLQGTS